MCRLVTTTAAVAAALTEVVETVASCVESTSVEFQTDNGKYNDSEQEQQGNVGQRTDGFSYGAHHHLQA